MKAVIFAVFILVIGVLYGSVAIASDSTEMRAEADQFYLDKNFKKAHKLYFKLAKTGDYFSQGRVSYMYANGEGKSVDLSEAYAWSKLAEEGGDSFVSETSTQLLGKISDKEAAQKKADKLFAKYGQKALAYKAQRRAEMDAARRSGSSMGSNLSR